MNMIKVYVSPSCSGCRKVEAFFKRRNVPFEKINIFKDLNYGDLLFLLTKSENGTDDIISTRSKIIKENKIDIDQMKTSELINFILKNPSVMHRPIIVSDNEMQVGYNEFNITSFIPRVRDYAFANCKVCATYKTCETRVEDKSINHR